MCYEEDLLRLGREIFSAWDSSSEHSVSVPEIDSLTLRTPSPYPFRMGAKEDTSGNKVSPSRAGPVP